MKNDQRPPQASLLLRLLGGGYLVYLAYSLFADNHEKPIFLAASILFGLVGGVLFVQSLLTLVRSGYFYNTPAEPKEEPDEEEEA